MRPRRRRAVEVPVYIKLFIANVTKAPLERIDHPLKDFVWEYDKGDFYHWTDLFNHFDTYFESYVKPRKDLQLDGDCLGEDAPFPREGVLEVLRVMRIILENCTNRHLLSSFENHLSTLLGCTDPEVVETSLQTLVAFNSKTVGKSSGRNANLTSKLFAISQGWGGKEGGLGLVACCLPKKCDEVSAKMGSTLHFEFYEVSGDVMKSSTTGEHGNGLKTIHISNIMFHKEDDLVLLSKLVKEHRVPASLNFPLFTRLRFARAFRSEAARHQWIRIRLYAFIALIQAGHDSEYMTSFFSNEPEFVEELLSLLGHEDEIPEKVRILSVLSLVALCNDRSHEPSVVSAVSSGSYRGVLPSLMQKAVESIISGLSKYSIVFAESLLSLISILVSSIPGSLALQEAGFITIILPLLKDIDPQHLHLVSSAVHVMEGFLDYHNPSLALFRDLGGLNDTIGRLKAEVLLVEDSFESVYSRKGKEIADSVPGSSFRQSPSEALVSYNRRILIKALLRTISLATYVPGSASLVDGSEESLLPLCLCTIFKRARDFGGGVFALAANVMIDLIHKDPTCFHVLETAGLPQAFIESILDGVPPGSDALTCIPPSLESMCLNVSGLQLVKERNALSCFVKIFTSRSYLKALSAETTGVLSGGLDELMRHASSLRSCGVDMLIEACETISKLGSDTSMKAQCSFPVQRETTKESAEEKTTCSQEAARVSSVSDSEKMIDCSMDSASISYDIFVLECVSNIARLLEKILHNSETCRLFVEKRGVEAVLNLLKHPLMPISLTLGHSVSISFKSFSPQHSVTLGKSICLFLREQLKSANELLGFTSGGKLDDVEPMNQQSVLRGLSSLEGLVSIASFVLKGNSTMLLELATADADILKELGKIYIEIVWQISLLCDRKAEGKQDINHENGVSATSGVLSRDSGDASTSNSLVRESDDELNAVPARRYPSPLFPGSSSSSVWGVAHDFVSLVRSAAGIHRHGRHSVARLRGGRLSRHLDATRTDVDLFTQPEYPRPSEAMKENNPEALASDVLVKLGFTMRAFLSAIVKGLQARRRADNLTVSFKSLVTALAQLFFSALSFSGHSTAGFEMSLSVKCRYLGRVVTDMATLIFDSRRRSCNSALVNIFYGNGVFKELLTTFEATSQLLWTVPSSRSFVGFNHESPASEKAYCSSWLLDTLLSYCRLLECYSNSAFLLSSPSNNQYLVQPIISELSINLFPVPREPADFVRLIQSHVLEAILPVWNHPMFPNCSPALVTSLISIINCIYSGVGDHKPGHGGIGSSSLRLRSPPLDELAVATILEMGFSRARAEEALRSVGMNSVEMATDWLFNHPEEFVHEDVQLAQALALSLGGSVESSKEDCNDKHCDTIADEKGVATLPLEDILTVSMKLFQCSDVMDFSLSDLLRTLCSRNKGEDRRRVALYLIQQLKLAPSDFSADIGMICSISHTLVILLSEDSYICEIAAENALASVVLDVLDGFRLIDGHIVDSKVEKTLSSLLLILDGMLQFKLKYKTDATEYVHKSSADPMDVDFMVDKKTFDAENNSDVIDSQKACNNVIEKSLGKSTGYLTPQEAHRALTVSCDYMKLHVPVLMMQAVLQICARLTKTYALAMQFLETGGLTALLSLPRACIFPGFENLASVIVRHLIEDSQTLQNAMEVEIRQFISSTIHHSGSRLSSRNFLTSMAPLICRDPEVFLQAAISVCQLDSSGSRLNIILLKDKEKDREKSKVPFDENGIPCNEPVRLAPETKNNETSNRCSRGQKKVPFSLTQVIDQLVDAVMRNSGNDTFSCTSLEVDEPNTKGKTKVNDESSKLQVDCISELSSWFLKLILILKLISDILLMYVPAVGMILRKDTEISQMRTDVSRQHGLLSYILNHLFPLSSGKSFDTPDKLKEKLAEKALRFLVSLCSRSTEGRRRVICEIVRAFYLLVDSARSSSRVALIPDRKVLAFAELVNSVLSRNGSPYGVPGIGCSPDIAKAMIDGGMVQSLSNVLRVIDLDHPDAPKALNLILKALETLTRTANASNQVFKSDLVGKNRQSMSHIRTGITHGRDEAELHPGTTSNLPRGDTSHSTELTGSSRNDRNADVNQDHSEQHDMLVNRAVSIDGDISMDHREDIHDGSDNGNLMPAVNDVLNYTVNHHVHEVPEDDEDLGEDGEDDEDDGEEMVEEGAPLMSVADTDIEEQENNTLGDDYNEDMMDEDDEEFHPNDIIEVRWRENLHGSDQFRVSRGRVDPSNFIDIAAESFQDVDSDNIFTFPRPYGTEHRHQSESRRQFDHPRSDVSSYQHPLLVRPPQSTEGVASALSRSGPSSRDLHALIGNVNLPHLYMIDSGVASDASAALLGERVVSSAAPPLFDFSIGVESLHSGSRRGHGNNMWTDDGQAPAGSYAASVAQAVEDHFVLQLRLSSYSNSTLQPQPAVMGNNPVSQQPITHNVDNQDQSHFDVETRNANCNSSLGQEVLPLSQEVGISSSSAAGCPSGVANLPDGNFDLPDGNFGELTLPEDINTVLHGDEVMLMEQAREEEHLPIRQSHTRHEVDSSSCNQQISEHQHQDGSDTLVGSHIIEFNVDQRETLYDLEGRSSCQALITPTSLPELGTVERNGAEGIDDTSISCIPCNADNLPSRRSNRVSQEACQDEQSNANNATSTADGIDPTFLAALPQDLRAEVLASHQSRPVQPASCSPSTAEEIDPEFLAALPPDIQAEVLSQQQAQRNIHSQPIGQPVDMDNASIIATFPPELREEVLLTSSEAVLSALPSALLAEAHMLRDRELSRYRARGSLFGGSYRLGERRFSAESQTVMDRGVGVAVGSRIVTVPGSVPKNSKDVEGVPLLDSDDVKSLIRLLQLAKPLSKGLLQRLMLNICANGVSRNILTGHLLNMVRLEADGFDGSQSMANLRLHGCQSDVVYARPQCPSGLPPLVSRRLLEMLTYLASSHSSVADLLCFHPALSDTAENHQPSGENTSNDVLADKGYTPIVLFLKLLRRSLFLRSRVHLEQVMLLLEVIVDNAATKKSSVDKFFSDPLENVTNQSQVEYSAEQQVNAVNKGHQTVAVKENQSVDLYDILIALPETELQNLSTILAVEGLSDKVYSLAAKVLKKLAVVGASHRKFFAVQLANSARDLSAAAVAELATVREMQILGLNCCSMAGSAILRVLQTLSVLTSDGMEQHEHSILWDLNVVLEPLWQELSDCISTVEAKLGQVSAFSYPAPLFDDDEPAGASLSGPLPPGAQQLLPFIESYFVLCEKLQKTQNITHLDYSALEGEVKDLSGSCSPLPVKSSGTSNVTFARIAEKHRRLLNVFIRQNPSLLEKSLSMMLKVPRLIDFDNKRAYFRSRIRQQHDHHLSAPLRINVRRSYVLEDSYNQLRLRRTQDLKGRLTVQFQGEEGIDAGGLTREWYQILSRVIFDKGALLFTTVGNNASFQPNPNSVYQTEHLSYFKFVGRVVSKALYDGQLLDVHFTRSFYKHILGVKVTYHDIEAVDPDYYKNLKWMLENDVSDIPDLTFSIDPDEEKHILYEKSEVTDYELKPGGRNIRVTEETKHEYVGLVAEHMLTNAIRPQITAFLEGFTELVPRELISIFNDKELELLISGLPEIDLDDLQANAEYIGYSVASPVIQWFWEVVKGFNKEDMARLLQFVTGTSKVPLEGFKALQGISGPQRFQIHKAYGAPERLPSAHTCFNQLDLPEYSSKEQLEDRLLLAIHEASEGFGFG